MKLHINDIQLFDILLTSVIRIVPDAMFELSEDGVKIKVINESQTIRAFYDSQCFTSDEGISFAFKDLINLKQSVNLIGNIESVNQCDLDFNKTFISYKNEVKFKLKVVKPDIISQYVTQDLKTKLNDVFAFNTGVEEIKKVLQCANIVSNTDSKVYISQSNDKVIAEVDDKLNKMANSVGIPISDSTLKGSIETPIAVSIDNFQLFSVLPPGLQSGIRVVYTDKNVFVIIIGTEKIHLKMISTTLKG